MLRIILFATVLLVTVAESHSATTNKGRYTYEYSHPENYQIDTLAQPITVKFPASIQSYLDGISTILAPAGFDLSGYISEDALRILKKPLPIQLRSFKNLPRRTIIQTLLPDTLFLVTDPHNQLAGFDFKPQFASFANTGEIDQQTTFSDPTSNNKVIEAETPFLSDPVSVNTKTTVCIQPHEIDVTEEQLHICAGSLKPNIDRLAKQLGLNVVWDKIPSCVNWNIKASFVLPDLKATNTLPISAVVFAYVLDSYPLIPEITKADNLLVIHPAKKFKCAN